jgi:membrane fusion protein, copper/silver efflux system
MIRMGSRAKFISVAALAGALGMGLGMQINGGATPADQATSQPAVTAAAEVWTCAMHPQIRMPAPGLCPICAMDLIPLATETDDGLGPRQLRMTPAAQQLAGIQVTPIRHGFPRVETRLVGKIAVDETRMRSITAWVPGRIDRLYVDYTGISVKAGDHMASLYSPQLLTAQQELIEALRTAQRTTGSARQSALLTVAAARDKLRLWGLGADQIASIERADVPSDHLTVHARTGGVVVEKHLNEGAYVQTGTRIYTIADLSTVWIQLDAYESDLAWLRYGQSVGFDVEAIPGKTFTGRIAFISPLVDERTRTVKLRVNVPNADGLLKPGMFVAATVRSRVAGSGRVMEEDLAGKWISPMHPEIIKDAPGPCDICGMPLVRAEDLGYATVASAAGPPLLVPSSAVLLTGKRAVVYVAVAGQDGVFEGREVELGARAGDEYVVTQGLVAGEQVVTNGSFKIDSALQIRAKPSMMNPQGGGAAAEDLPVPVPVAFQQQLGALFDAYFAVHAALSQADPGPLTNAAQQWHGALTAMDMSLLAGESHMAWMPLAAELGAGDAQLSRSDDPAARLQGFEQISESLTRVARRMGTGLPGDVYSYHCPMAFDNRGANWLQQSQGTVNPYFGGGMLKCGSQTEAFSATRQEGEGP